MRSHFGSLWMVLLLANALLGGKALAESRPTSLPDQQIATSIARKLQRNDKLHHVRVSVQQGAVSLQGTVERYADKLKAQKEARHAGHVDHVNDHILVAGVSVPDAELQDRLARKPRV
jgi:hypothetical protein